MLAKPAGENTQAGAREDKHQQTKNSYGDVGDIADKLNGIEFTFSVKYYFSTQAKSSN